MEVNEEIREGNPSPQRLKDIRALNNSVYLYVTMWFGGHCCWWMCGTPGHQWNVYRRNTIHFDIIPVVCHGFCSV